MILPFSTLIIEERLLAPRQGDKQLETFFELIEADCFPDTRNNTFPLNGAGLLTLLYKEFTIASASPLNAGLKM